MTTQKATSEGSGRCSKRFSSRSQEASAICEPSQVGIFSAVLSVLSAPAVELLCGIARSRDCLEAVACSSVHHRGGHWTSMGGGAKSRPGAARRQQAAGSGSEGETMHRTISFDKEVIGPICKHGGHRLPLAIRAYKLRTTPPHTKRTASTHVVGYDRCGLTFMMASRIGKNFEAFRGLVKKSARFASDGTKGTTI